MKSRSVDHSNTLHSLPQGGSNAHSALHCKEHFPGAGHPRMFGGKSWLSERLPTQGKGFLPAFGRVDGAELCSFLLLAPGLLSEDRLLRGEPCSNEAILRALIYTVNSRRASHCQAVALCPYILPIITCFDKLEQELCSYWLK